MPKLGELLDRMKGVRAMVIGDLMLDEYIFGRATRISPEAPVMVVRQTRTASVPGGAANVALNIIALGGQATMVGVIGDDAAGSTLCRSLLGSGIDDAALVRDAERLTTRKTRVLADHAHQVLRIDHEDEEPVGKVVEDRLLATIRSHLAESQVVLLSDYLKGTLSRRVIEETVSLARERSVPVVANPKPRSLRLYSGCRLVSLNRLEAGDALGRWQALSDEEAPEAAHLLRGELGAESVMITLGEGGMAVAGEERFRVEAPRVEVYDTAGAGDTVIATVALGLAAAGFSREVFELAVQTSASVVKHVGVATPSQDDLARIREM